METKPVPAVAYDDEWAENYARRAQAGIPGRDGLYRCLAACFADLPSKARILVVGCGTGEEVLELAAALPAASFVAVDPAAAMLRVCEARLSRAGVASRVELIEGLVQDVSEGGRFDAATSILVAQHLEERAEALEFFRAIADRLQPGGRLYSADLHIGEGQDRDRLIALWRRQARMAGIEPELVDNMAQRFVGDLRPRSEREVLSLLSSAGFVDVLKPFSSLLYGAWYAHLGQGDRTS